MRRRFSRGEALELLHSLRSPMLTGTIKVGRRWKGSMAEDGETGQAGANCTARLHVVFFSMPVCPASKALL
jgi:hypothetical protein